MITIERENGTITLEEWYDYIAAHSELILSEGGTMTNPITKAKITMKIVGRAIWNKYYVFTNKDGKIIGDGEDYDELIKKMSEIAADFSASLFDCGEKIEI